MSGLLPGGVTVAVLAAVVEEGQSFGFVVCSDFVVVVVGEVVKVSVTRFTLHFSVPCVVITIQ